jgi:hypothetical protein
MAKEYNVIITVTSVGVARSLRLGMSRRIVSAALVTLGLAVAIHADWHFATPCPSSPQPRAVVALVGSDSRVRAHRGVRRPGVGNSACAGITRVSRTCCRRRWLTRAIVGVYDRRSILRLGIWCSAQSRSPVVCRNGPDHLWSYARLVAAQLRPLGRWLTRSRSSRRFFGRGCSLRSLPQPYIVPEVSSIASGRTRIPTARPCDTRTRPSVRAVA